ncbi:MAG: alpha/beta hydrolase [Gammaproteobacteria bacterium]|nr:MAG: alpha/beta hydrolase [Gammaproteobacteria bacterium]
MRILLTLTGLLALNMIAACSGVFFYPQKALLQTPDQSGLDYEDVFLESTDNVTIHGWWLKAKTPVRGTVYFLHGNAENISTHFHNVAWLPEHGYQVFALDYRGFGKSQGKAGLPGTVQDIGTGFRFVMDRNADLDKPVYLLGQSLGASMAIYFAATDAQAKQSLSAVISDAAFTRYSEIARYATGQSWLTWLLQYPVSWSVIRGYDPVDYIAEISPVPLLLIHSKNDPVIPYAFGQALLQAAMPPKTLLTTTGPHTATFRSQKNREFLLEFLADTGK